MEYLLVLISLISGYLIAYIYHVFHYYTKLKNIVYQIIDFLYFILISFILCLVYNKLDNGRFNIYLLLMLVMGSLIYYFRRKKEEKNLLLLKSLFLLLLPFFQKVLSFLFVPKIFLHLRKK